jgi:hypothetical protein
LANKRLAQDHRSRILPHDLVQTKHSFEGCEQLHREAQEACDRLTAKRSPHIDKLCSTLESLRDHAPIFDIIAQQQQIAAFVWGSIRLIIKVGKGSASFLRLLVRLMRLGHGV